MNRIGAIAFLLAALCGACLFGQARPRLAILPFTGGTGGDGETIAALFSYDRELSGVFTIIPRTISVEAVMKEQQFQRSSGLTDADTIARLGRQYNADYVVAGHVLPLGAGKLVFITIIHVASLRQIAGDYGEYKDIEQVQAMIPDMTKRIVSASRTGGAALPQLAVLPFAVPAGMDAGDAEVLAQLLTVEIVNSGKYAVLPRTTMIRSVMAEREIQRSGLTEAGNIKAIGQALNARYVLAGSVRSLGRANLFTAEIINIETMSRLAGDAVNYRAVGDGLKLMPEFGAHLTGGAAPVRSVPAVNVPDRSVPDRNVPAVMMLVEGGTFLMGNNSGADNEKPEHAVTVKGFYMGRTEVTQKEWREIMGTTVRQQRDKEDKSWPLCGEGDNYPMYYVSWYEAVEYCNKLSLKEGLTPAYRGSGGSTLCDFNAAGYRLPTEAEWEYAAKGGNKDPVAYEYSGGNNVNGVAWYNGNSGSGTRPVGTKLPNSLGLYDMSGNVWEWCWDWYGNYRGGNQSNPLGPVSAGTGRVNRGGSWLNDAAHVRSAPRSRGTPSGRFNYLGFRLVRSQ
jgi:formylglycine-generating enzyme required for sulfatase activity/TolB-like protein